MIIKIKVCTTALNLLLYHSITGKQYSSQEAPDISRSVSGEGRCVLLDKPQPHRCRAA